MPETGKTKIVLPERIQRGDVIRVQVVMQHPMDTGFFRDANANIKPDKRKSRNKIDGVVALVNALDRAMRKEGKGPSVYDQRGVLDIAAVGEGQSGAD